jgi:hypothetical protein
MAARPTSRCAPASTTTTDGPLQLDVLRQLIDVVADGDDFAAEVD